jgi:hypothetical protein
MHFNTGGVSYSSAMVCMKSAKIKIAIGPAGAANTCYDYNFVLVNAGFFYSSDQGIDNNAIAAAGTPHMGEFISPQKFIEYMLLCHFSASLLISLKIFSAVIICPSF